MAKPKSAKKAGGASKRRPSEPEELPSDLEMEADTFHKQRERDILKHDAADDSGSDDSLDSLDEEEVLGMEDSDASSEEYDTEDEIEAETKYGKREWPQGAA